MPYWGHGLQDHRVCSCDACACGRAQGVQIVEAVFARTQLHTCAQATADIQARDQGGAPSCASSSLASLLASIPAWHALRPHLTGRDLVVSGRASRRASQTQTAGSSGHAPSACFPLLPCIAREYAVCSARLGLSGQFVRPLTAVCDPILTLPRA